MMDLPYRWSLYLAVVYSHRVGVVNFSDFGEEGEPKGRKKTKKTCDTLGSWNRQLKEIVGEELDD